MSDYKFTGDAATQAQKIAAAKADLKLLGRGVPDNASPDDVIRVMKDYIEEKNLGGASNDVDAIRTIHRQALNQILGHDNNALWDVQKRLYYLDASHEMGQPIFAGEGMAMPPEVEVRPEGKADQVPGTVDRLMDYNGENSKGFRSAQDEITELQRLSRLKPPAADPRYQWDAKTRTLCNDYVSGEVGNQVKSAVGLDGLVEMQAALQVLGYDKNVPTGTWTGANAAGVSKFISDMNTWRKPPVSVDWNNPDSVKNFRQVLFDSVKGRKDYDQTQLIKEGKDLTLAPPDGMDKDSIRQAQLYMNLIGVHGKETVTHHHTLWFDTHPEVDFTYGKSPTGEWSKRDAQAVEAYCKEKGLDPNLSNPDNKKKFLDSLKADVQKKLGDGVNVDNYTTMMLGMVDGKHAFSPDKQPDPPAKTNPDTKTGPDTKTTPVKKTEPAVDKKLLPDAKAETPKLQENTKDSKITDNDVGQSQARLFLMGYGGDHPIDGKHPSLDAMLTKYAVSKGIIKDGEKLEGNNHKKAFEQMNADWGKFAQAHPATIKAIVDKGAAIRDNHDNNKDVLQMQTVLLAMGGKFNKYGLDGKNWNETRGAIDATSAPEGQLGKLLAPYKVEGSPWYKPGPTTPTETKPDPNKTPTKTDTAPTKKKIENVWEDPVDDPFGGDGGFIKPAATQPTVEVKNDQTPGKRPQDDFTRAAGNGQTDDPSTKDPSTKVPAYGNNLPAKGTMSSYFNDNAQSTLASATAHFSHLNGDFVMDANRNGGYPLEVLPYAKTGHDQGLAFLTGPDGRFGAIYSVNPGSNGKLNMTYMKTYDLTDTSPDPKHERNGLESFNHDKQEAEEREAKAVRNESVSGGPSMPMRLGVSIGPSIYEPRRFEPQPFRNPRFERGPYH